MQPLRAFRQAVLRRRCKVEGNGNIIHNDDNDTIHDDSGNGNHDNDNDIDSANENENESDTKDDENNPNNINSKKNGNHHGKHGNINADNANTSNSNSNIIIISSSSRSSSENRTNIRRHGNSNQKNKTWKLERTLYICKFSSINTKIRLIMASGAPNTRAMQPQGVLKTMFGSKKRATEARGSSKTNLEAFRNRPT